MFVVMTLITKAFEVVIIKRELRKVSKILFVMNDLTGFVLSFGSATFTLVVLSLALAVSEITPSLGVIERRYVATLDQHYDPFGGYFPICHNKKGSKDCLFTTILVNKVCNLLHCFLLFPHAEKIIGGHVQALGELLDHKRRRLAGAGNVVVNHPDLNSREL